MWLRVGKRQRWTAGDATKAEQDLIPREGEDLSVYRVKNLDDGRAVAAMFAAVNRLKPDSIDFVLLPEDSISGAALSAQKTSIAGQPKKLDDLHYEIPGLDAADKRATVASLAIAGGVMATRLGQREVVQIVRGMMDDSDLRKSVGVGWLPLLVTKAAP